MSAASLIRAQGGGATLTVNLMTSRRDGVEAEIRDWGPDGPTLDCWVQPIGSGLAAQYQARQLRVTHKIFVAENPGATQEGCRVKVTKSGAVGVYLVRGVVDQAGLGRLWRIDVEEVH